MRSDTHKVLHPIASRPLLLHLLDRVDALGADKRVVVVGKGREQVEAAIAGPRRRQSPSRPSRRAPAMPSSRPRRRWRAMTGRSSSSMATRRSSRPTTLRRMLDRLDGDGGPGVVVLASSPGRSRCKYGRIILGEGDRIAKMVEYQGRDRGGARGPPVQFAA